MIIVDIQIHAFIYFVIYKLGELLCFARFYLNKCYLYVY